ncbi:MAG: SagB/ThcOx family dehydrogenase, partial [Rubrivivax sp.]
MDKLLWVTAPLALAVVALGWAAWRGRLPSRTGLNVAFSLLLLVYVLGTAGLGIFWVANQQLPVFDWHYLFGYVTVALLVVHLGFNFRVVWHVLRRALGGGTPRPPAGGSAPQPPLGGSARKPPLGGERHAAGLGEQAAAARAARATPADRAAHVSSGRWAGAPTATRRAALRLIGLFGGLAAAAGAGYLLGLRHGRTEIVLPPPPGQTGPAQVGEAGGAATAGQEARQQAWALVERLPGWTSHTRTGVLRRAASLQWALAPAPFKHYPQAERLSLGPPSSAPRDAAAKGHPLGTWLWHVAGVSALSGGIAFRTSPSSGALFATELYVQVIDLPGVPPGLWHYDAQGHALEQLHVQGKRTGSALDTAVDLPPGCVAVVLASAVFARSGHKYGDRTYRYVTADLGHALENLRVATQATGMEATPLQQFDDDAMTAHLGLDGRTEAVLAVVAIRPRPARWPDAAAARPAGGAAAPRAAPADRAGSSIADGTPAPWGPAGGPGGPGG